MENFKEKADKELESMNTKNLLAYHKAERKRYHKWHGSKVCDCCGEVIGSRDFIKQVNDETKIKTDYLARIKSILSKREHVEKNNLKLTDGNRNKTKQNCLHRSRVR